MPYQLPLIPSNPNYRVGSQLGERQYLLDIRWNTRDEAWYLTVLSEEGDVIRSGLKLVLGALVGVRVRDPDFPDGVFVVSDLSNTGLDAGLDDMGARVAVHFYTRAELLG